MNVFALSESVKQTKLENGPNHFSILRKPRFICSLDKALSFSEEKKCFFKAKKHKIILWKKKSLFLKQNLHISQLLPQKGLLAFMTPCPSNTQMEVYN